MENKTEFLNKVLNLFYLNGAKTTTMDDIAHAFSMSKKTLYQLYNKKENLLEDVLDYELQLITEALHDFDAKDDCSIKKMLKRDKKIKDLSENSNYSLFARQLKKYYYPIFEKQVYKIEKIVAEVFAKNVIKGREQGVYRDNFDYNEYAKFFMLIVFSYDDSPLINTEKTSRRSHTQNAIIMILNAMTNNKGKEILNKYLYNDK